VGVARGVITPVNFLADLVVLCFERRRPKQNTVARLKLKNLPLKILGWLGYRLHYTCEKII